MKTNYVVLLGLLLFKLSGLSAQTNLNIFSYFEADRSHLLADIQKITFGPDTLSVKLWNGDIDSVGISQMQRIDFTQSIVTRAENPISKKVQDVLLYPNPVNSTLNLRLNLEQGEQIEIDIYNQKGQSVKCTVQRALLSELNINVEHLKSGLYLCRIKTAEQSITKKFIKQ